MLEWVVISFSRRPSLLRDWNPVSRIVGRRFTVWATRTSIDCKWEQMTSLVRDQLESVWWCSGAKSFLTLCDLLDCSAPGFPVLHYLPEFAQTHVCWVGDAIQPSHPLSSLSPPAFNLSQHQGLFQWASSWHQMATVLEFQLQQQSFQWIFRVDCL